MSSNGRGCLTAHFVTKIDLDYPCALATNTSLEAAAAKGEHTIPYVANVTQATLEIRKSRLFIEKFEDKVQKGIINIDNNNNKNNGKKPMKVKYASKEEEAQATVENNILSDPFAAIANTHFVLNAIPEIGNVGRPLALTHFYVDNSHLVAPPLTTVVGGRAPTDNNNNNNNEDLLAVVRMPIHMCSSVGKQGRNEQAAKTMTEREKKRQRRKEQLDRAALGEGGSFGLEGLELIYVPRRPQSNKNKNNNNDEISEVVSGPQRPPHHNKNKNNGSKKKPNTNDDDTPANRRDVFPAAYFDVSVTIAGVQYTYLLSGQFDVLAGRTAPK